jgi:hypothetical protein
LFASGFVLWLLSFVVEKLHTFKEIQMFAVSAHDVGMDHMPDDNLPEYQTGIYCGSIMLFSNIPYRVQSLNNAIKHSSLH